MKQRETYATIVDELQELKNWLHKCYEVEADTEIHEVEQCEGDIRKMSQPRILKDLRPGNEDLYVTPEKKATRPKINQPVQSFLVATALPANGAKSPKVWRGGNTP